MQWIARIPEFLLAALTAHGIALGPAQPTAGPGGQAYAHAEVRMVDRADEPGGYWWFEPREPVPDTARLVVFLHGYGNYNPMIYGGWIRHLVRRGHVVLFPRYQRNLFFPFPARFVPHAAAAFRRARSEMPAFSDIAWDTSSLVVVGHSYGGVIAANLAVRYQTLGLPRPAGVLLAMPGSGIFPGGRLKSYKDLHPQTYLLAVTGARDGLVGERFARKVVETAPRTARTALLELHPDGHGHPVLMADHIEAYAPDQAFDSGDAPCSSKRAARKGEYDAFDFFGLWKWTDQLLDCSSGGSPCPLFSNLPGQVSLSRWSDGQPMRPVEIEIHPNRIPE